MTSLRIFIAVLGLVASAVPSKGAAGSFTPTKTSETNLRGTVVVAAFPSAGIGVGEKHSLVLEFGPASLTAEFAAGRLNLPLAGQRGDVSVALDVYLEPEGPSAAGERKESGFVGSRVARMRETDAALAVPVSFFGLESALAARNRAVGGTNSDWGAKNVAALVRSEKPDLCVIAFGMNDRSAEMASAVFESNMRAMMNSVREKNPAVDFILVASMVNNPDWGPVQPLSAYREILLRLEGPGVAVADLTAIHRFLLTRKDYIAMSNNNLNHSNDYLVRWYAQAIGALLIPSWTPGR